MRKQIFLFSLFLYSFLGELIFTQEIEYTWKQEFYSQLAGKDALSFAQEMNVAKLCFIDIDSDEDLDLFLGKEDGKIAFFENQGSTVKPRLILQTQALDGIFFEFVDKKKHRIRKTIDVGNRSVPTLEDIDHDGDYDLLIGNQKGELWFFQNNGDNFIPKFELITKQFHTILAGKNVVPRFIDANLDQRYDLIIGNRAGELWLFMNQGTRKLALYDSVGQKISIHSENNPQKMSHISPSFVDWDNDGDLDLVIGQKNGSLSYLINSGDRFNPIWEPTNDAFPYLDIGGEAAPTFVDLEEDGNLDLFIGNINTPILFYENRPLEKGRELWKISANYFNFQKMILTGQRASITSGDLDQDGDMDLILGEAKGNLNYYENQGNNQKANWKLQTENMISMINIENSSPELGDIDADGDLDLLVGRHSGQISFIENIGTAKKPTWQFKAKTFSEIDIGSNSIPRLFDIDKDGDLDLFIGNYKGKIIFYRNQGTPKKFDFILEDVNFTKNSLLKNATLALFDWNQDQKLDFVVGQETGVNQLMLFPKEEELQKQWERFSQPLIFSKAVSLSHPYFMDINGDQKTDFLIGDGRGDILLYVNQTSKKIIVHQIEEKKVDNSIDEEEGSLVITDLMIEKTQKEDVIEDSIEIDETVVQDSETTSKKMIEPIFKKEEKPLLTNFSYKRPALTFGDLDGDGDQDLLIGTKNGTLLLYLNEGEKNQWQFTLSSTPFVQSTMMQSIVPELLDFDEDQDLDLILGDQTGRLHYYENIGDQTSYKFNKIPEVFQKVKVGQFSSPATFKRKDGKWEIISGNLQGKLVKLNVSDTNQPIQIFEIFQRDYLNIDVGFTSTPKYIDFNQDDIPELVIGSDSGKITFLEQRKNESQLEWKEITRYGNDLQFSPGSIPTATDIDLDGDLDLIVGSNNGDVVLYRNDAIVALKNNAIKQ